MLTGAGQHDHQFERCEAAGVNWDGLLSDAVCPWFAGCWQAVGTPQTDRELARPYDSESPAH
jgi:hypothetical protein